MIGYVPQKILDLVRAGAFNPTDTRTVLQTVGPKLAASFTPTAVAPVRGGGVQQAVPKKAAASSSSMTPILIVGGLVAVGAIAFIVMKKRKG